jgi:ribosomal protein L35
MSKLKTHKSIAKRVVITKNGKVLKRMAGQDHFNTRDRGKITRKKRRDRVLSEHHARILRQFVPYN